MPAEEAAGAAAASGSSDTATVDYAAHPHAGADEVPERPVPVVVQMSWMDYPITAWSDETAEATMTFSLYYFWTDPRLAGWTEGRSLPDPLWSPATAVFGAWNDGASAGTTTFAPGGEGTGALKMTRVIASTVACKRDIAYFPLDTHCIIIRMTLGQTGLGTTKYATAGNRPGVDGQLLLNVREINDAGGIPQADEWVVRGVGFGLAYHQSGVNRYDDIILNLHRRRDPTYFIHKAIYPLMAAVLMSSAAVVLPAEALADRIGLVFTLFLTVFAIQWVTTDRLPRTPFLTQLDRINTSAIVMYVLLAMTSIGLHLAIRLGVAEETIELLELLSGGCFFFMITVWAIIIKWNIRTHTTRAASGSDVAPDDAVLTYNPNMKLYEDSAFWLAVDEDGKLGPPLPAMVGHTGDRSFAASQQGQPGQAKQAWG